MFRRNLVAAALLLALSAPVAAQSVKAGIEAWQRADYSGAVAIWRPLAEAGDADAAFNLGQAYRLGRGVPTNLASAKNWFERAAQKNHVDAQTTLGLLLFQNGEQAEGLKWLKAAAEQGEARALLVYGTALFNGDGVTQDPVMGYAYVSRAAAQGLAPARETLAQLDKLMPIDQRKKGVAIAKTKAKTAPPPTSNLKPAKPVRVATAKPGPTPGPKPLPPAPQAAPASKPAPAPAKPTPAPASAAPAGGRWRIQVGAFNSRASAEAAYRKLAGNAALAGRGPQYIPFNQFIRLRIGPFASKDGAAAACSALHVPCYPVAPGK
jgi:cell division septation protein DedD